MQNEEGREEGRVWVGEGPTTETAPATQTATAETPAEAPLTDEEKEAKWLAEGRIVIRNNPDGTMTVFTPGEEPAADESPVVRPVQVETFKDPRVERAENEIAGSAARRKLHRLRKGQPAPNQSLVESREIEGDQFFFRRLRWSEIIRCHLMSSRDSAGTLDLSENSDDLRSFSIAVLSSVVCTDGSGDTDYFSMQDAAEWHDSTELEVARLLGFLFDAAIETNPNLIPKIISTRIPPLMRPEETGDVSSQAVPETFTPSIASSGDSSSTATPGTAPDAI